MSFKTGKDFVLTIDGVEIDVVRDVTFPMDKEIIEDRYRGDNGWTEKVGGYRSWRATFDMRYDPTDAGWIAVRDAFYSSDNVSISTITTDEAGGFSGTGTVANFEPGEPLQGAATTSVTFEGSGLLTPTPAIVE